MNQLSSTPKDHLDCLKALLTILFINTNTFKKAKNLQPQRLSKFSLMAILVIMGLGIDTNINAQSQCDSLGIPCTVSLGFVGTAGTAMDGTEAPFMAPPNCLLLDNAEASAYRGFMFGCTQTGCPITCTPPTSFPTFNPSSVSYTHLTLPTICSV